MQEFTFKFFRPRLDARQFVQELNKLYRSNQKFARLIGTQVAPAWAAGTLIVEVLPKHRAALEWFIANFWSANSGMTKEEALIRAKIGQTTLKGAKALTPDQRARKAKKLQNALSAYWNGLESAPEPVTLLVKRDEFAGTKRWMRADENDLKRVGEWKDDGINIPFRSEDPMDLRPMASPSGVGEIHVEEFYEDRDTSGDRSHEEWAHGTARRTVAKVGDEWIQLDEVQFHAARLARVAAAMSNTDMLDELEDALEAAEARNATPTWAFVQIEDETGSAVVRVRAWKTTNRLPGTPPPFLPKEKRRVMQPVEPKHGPDGLWYHSSIAEWERIAKKDKAAAAALQQFQEEQAEREARRALLNKDHDTTQLDSEWEPTPAEILELLTDDVNERQELGEEVPAWLERQVAFYTHVVEKANQRAAQETAAASAQVEAPQAAALGGVVDVIRNSLYQLETELELSQGNARRGLVGEIAHLRHLLTEGVAN